MNCPEKQYNLFDPPHPGGLRGVAGVAGGCGGGLGVNISKVREMS